MSPLCNSALKVREVGLCREKLEEQRCNHSSGLSQSSKSLAVASHFRDVPNQDKKISVFITLCQLVTGSSFLGNKHNLAEAASSNRGL